MNFMFMMYRSITDNNNESMNEKLSVWIPGHGNGLQAAGISALLYSLYRKRYPLISQGCPSCDSPLLRASKGRGLSQTCCNPDSL